MPRLTPPDGTCAAEGGIANTLQCTNGPPESPRELRSSSSSASSAVPAGSPDHRSGGGLSRPSQVYCFGIARPDATAGLVRPMVAGTLGFAGVVGAVGELAALELLLPPPPPQPAVAAVRTSAAATAALLRLDGVLGIGENS